MGRTATTTRTRRKAKARPVTWEEETDPERLPETDEEWVPLEKAEGFWYTECHICGALSFNQKLAECPKCGGAVRHYRNLDLY